MGLALLIICVSLRPAIAATPDSPASPPAQQRGGDPAKPSASEQEPPAAGSPAAEPLPAVPQLQLEDEGPAARKTNRMSIAASNVVVDPRDERPFWKSWMFWAVTGALVAGAVGLALYTSSGTNSSLAPCPPEVQVSLGCYGAGRGP